MFIGSINRYMRAVLEQAAGQWKGLPVYVACSGNFTVERILARCGVGQGPIKIVNLEPLPTFQVLPHRSQNI
jgi:hypothetical protein